MPRKPRNRTAEEINEDRRRSGRMGGLTGGRPKAKERCPCRANSLKRAIARNYDCCRKAGVAVSAIEGGNQ